MSSKVTISKQIAKNTVVVIEAVSGNSAQAAMIDALAALKLAKVK